jgi:hypothetical protein
MQIGVECIENLFMTTMLKTNKNKNMTHSKKKPFHSSLLENWLNGFWFGIIIGIIF